MGLGTLWMARMLRAPGGSKTIKNRVRIEKNWKIIEKKIFYIN